MDWVLYKLRGVFEELGNIGVLLSLLLLFIYWVMFPWIAIWALNTLFQFNIAFTFKTWVASLILITVFKNKDEVKAKD